MTTEEIIADSGLTRSEACDWALYSQTIQGNLSILVIYNEMVNHSEYLQGELADRNKALLRQYEQSKEMKAAVLASETPLPRKKFLGIF